MSHLPERKEKICLNCKSVIYGRFCHVCGQENTEPKETFWGLVTHFVYDITHFDGKFFDTTKYLLTRPGFLALEYLRGRRASYLNPIRMYVFTSAFFFIIFFSFIQEKDDAEHSEKERTELAAKKKKLEQKIAAVTDSAEKKILQQRLRQVNNDLLQLGRIGWVQMDDSGIDSTTKEFSFLGSDNMPRTVKKYDSIQNSLPENKRDGWLKKRMKRKIIAVNDKYRYNGREFWRNVNEKFMHSLPQMMFVSLPLVALVLQIIYVRRKQFYYVNHLIFSVYLYIATYLLLLLNYAVSALYEATDVWLFQLVEILVVIGTFFYTYKAMRNFYRQGRFKTVLKFMLFNLVVFFLMLILMIIYFFTSALQL